VSGVRLCMPARYAHMCARPVTRINPVHPHVKCTVKRKWPLRTGEPSIPCLPLSSRATVVASARHFLSAFLRYLALTRSAILSLRRVPFSLPVPSSDGAQKCYVRSSQGRPEEGDRSRTSTPKVPVSVRARTFPFTACAVDVAKR